MSLDLYFERGIPFSPKNFHLDLLYQVIYETVTGTMYIYKENEITTHSITTVL